MAIKKAIFRIFNGSTWDEYHHKTDSTQVEHGNTTVEAILTGTTVNATLANGATGEIVLRKYGNIVYASGCIKTTSTTAGAALAIIPAGYRPNRHIRLLAPRHDLYYGNIDINSDGVVSLVNDTQLSESNKEYYINVTWALIDAKKNEVEVISDKVVIPDSYNAGVESGIQLKEVTSDTLSGTTRLQMTQQVADNFCDSGGIISNYHFNGIYVDFNKALTQSVTFRNCKFTGDDNMAYAVAVSTYGVDKGISFENCEFSYYKSAVTSGTWKATFDKCYIHDMMQDGFKINHSDMYLKNSYIRSLGLDTTSHADGVQIENNTTEVTVHIYNCRFDQPFTAGNTENASIFTKCKDANIILDIQKCYATGGNYTIYALNSETAKVSGKVECVVGCSSRYGIANIADSVEQNVVSADSLFVSTVRNGELYVTNYTNKERILKIVTDIEEKTVTIPKSPTYSENHAQEFSVYPFDTLVEFSAGAKWVKCYENDVLIRTQKLGE